MNKILKGLTSLVSAEEMTLRQEQSSSVSGKTIELKLVTPSSVLIAVNGKTTDFSEGVEKEIEGLTIVVTEIFESGENSFVRLNIAGGTVTAEQDPDAPYCGDNQCNNGETANSCCSDCACAKDFTCVNEICQLNECSRNVDCNDSDPCTDDYCTITEKRCLHSERDDCTEEEVKEEQEIEEKQEEEVIQEESFLKKIIRWLRNLAFPERK